jgi:hypothetical protein
MPVREQGPLHGSVSAPGECEYLRPDPRCSAVQMSITLNANQGFHGCMTQVFASQLCTTAIGDNAFNQCPRPSNCPPFSQKPCERLQLVPGIPSLWSPANSSRSTKVSIHEVSWTLKQPSVPWWNSSGRIAVIQIQAPTNPSQSRHFCTNFGVRPIDFRS